MGSGWWQPLWSCPPFDAQPVRDGGTCVGASASASEKMRSSRRHTVCTCGHWWWNDKAVGFCMMCGEHHGMQEPGHTANASKVTPKADAHALHLTIEQTEVLRKVLEATRADTGVDPQVLIDIIGQGAPPVQRQAAQTEQDSFKKLQAVRALVTKARGAFDKACKAAVAALELADKAKVEHTMKQKALEDAESQLAAAQAAYLVRSVGDSAVQGEAPGTVVPESDALHEQIKRVEVDLQTLREKAKITVAHEVAKKKAETDAAAELASAPTQVDPTQPVANVEPQRVKRGAQQANGETAQAALASGTVMDVSGGPAEAAAAAAEAATRAAKQARTANTTAAKAAPLG